MKKTSIFLFSALIMIYFAIPSYAYSQQQLDQASVIVAEANSEIDLIITETVEKSEQILAQYTEGKFDLEKKNTKIQKLIDKMLDKTSRISEKAQRKGAKIGVDMDCTYIDILIDGQTISVDPVIIVGT